MLRQMDTIVFLSTVLVLMASCAWAWPVNYLAGNQGASVSTQLKLDGNADPNVLLSDGVVSKGRFTFLAGQDENQTFLVDLGQPRTFNRVNFGSVGLNEPRNASQVVIRVSTEGPDGPFIEVYRREKVGEFQILRLPEVTARWVQFDLGRVPEGSLVHSVRIYKGHTPPGLEEVMRLLDERLLRDVPGLEAYYQAARAKDWPKAAALLRAYYAERHVPKDPPNPEIDMATYEEYWNGPRGESIPIDWSYQETRDWYEYQKFLNRGRMIVYPIMAFYHTEDPVWKDRARAMLYDWLSANPCPPETVYADLPTWRTLDSAMRLGWLQETFPLITAASGLEDEVWANYLYSVWQHAHYLHEDKTSAGNWLSTITFQVMELALLLPEFREQRDWLMFGKTGFERNVLRDVYPDGKEMEDAPGYINMAYNGMVLTLKALDTAGIEVDAEVLRRMNLAQGFIGAITQPNGIMPAFGDCRGTNPYALPDSWEYFDRRDIQYILTKGQEGVKPDRGSAYFPDGAWAVMRSDFEYKDEPYEDARHLVFKASHGSHGHRDYLSFTLYAYGRPLLIDPGIKSYEREEGARYIQTAYHNTICMNGQNQPAKWGSIDRWVSVDGMDFLLSSYKGYEGLVHRRSLVFVKPYYWVLHDQVTGEGSHTADQNWHFNEDAGLMHSPASASVRTTYPEGGNLLMVPASTEGLVSQPKSFFIAKGGGAVAAGQGEVESTGWRYSRTGELPAVFDLVLYPYKGKERPRVDVRTISTGNPDATLLEIRSGGYTDYVLISLSGAVKETTPQLEVEAESMVLRTKGGKPVRLSGSQVKQITFQGQEVFGSPEAVEELDREL